MLCLLWQVKVPQSTRTTAAHMLRQRVVHHFLQCSFSHAENVRKLKQKTSIWIICLCFMWKHVMFVADLHRSQKKLLIVSCELIFRIPLCSQAALQRGSQHLLRIIMPLVRKQSLPIISYFCWMMYGRAWHFMTNWIRNDEWNNHDSDIFPFQKSWMSEYMQGDDKNFFYAC